MNGYVNSLFNRQIPAEKLFVNFFKKRSLALGELLDCMRSQLIFRSNGKNIVDIL